MLGRVVERVQDHRLALQPGDVFDFFEVRCGGRRRLGADLVGQAFDEPGVAAVGQERDGRRRGRRIVEITEHQPDHAAARAVAEHVDNRQIAGVQRVRQNLLEQHVVAMHQQQERFDHRRELVLLIAGDRLFEAPQHVLPHELRIAAIAVVARRGQLVVEQLSQPQERGGDLLAVGIGFVLGRVDQRGEQVVFVEPENAAAAIAHNCGSVASTASRKACDRWPCLASTIASQRSLSRWKRRTISFWPASLRRSSRVSSASFADSYMRRIERRN